MPAPLVNATLFIPGNKLCKNAFNSPFSARHLCLTITFCIPYRWPHKRGTTVYPIVCELDQQMFHSYQVTNPAGSLCIMASNHAAVLAHPYSVLTTPMARLLPQTVMIRSSNR